MRQRHSIILHFLGTPSLTCPQGYSIYEDSCYKFVKDTLKTFDDARKICKNENADLTSIDSQFEQGTAVDHRILYYFLLFCNKGFSIP